MAYRSIDEAEQVATSIVAKVVTGGGSRWSEPMWHNFGDGVWFSAVDVGPVEVVRHFDPAADDMVYAPVDVVRCNVDFYHTDDRVASVTLEGRRLEGDKSFMWQWAEFRYALSWCGVGTATDWYVEPWRLTTTALTFPERLHAI